MELKSRLISSSHEAGSTLPFVSNLPFLGMRCSVEGVLLGALLLLGDASALRDDQLFRDAGIDSLDHLNVLLAVEEQFGVEIPDEDSKSLNTLNALLAYLAAH